MHPNQAKKILKKRREQAFKSTEILDPNFPEQTNFILDPAKLKALFCTRRAAKSYTAGLYMIKTCLENPGVNCLFIGLTRASAKSIIWKDILRVLNKKHKLKAKFNSSELSMTFPNGSVIMITGVDTTEEEMNKLLGRKYKLCCIDEASLYTINLRHLIYDILGPAMVDQDGTIALFGTASNYTRGLFFEITKTKTEQGWKLFEWTAYQNPHINWAKQIEEIKKNRPLYMLTPQFRQWYLNHWVIETDKLVYKFDESKNLYDKLPMLKPDGWRYTLGVDLGYEDHTAMILTGYHDNDPHLYVIKEFAKQHMTFDDVVIKINEFMADSSKPISKVVIDGSVKQAIETMKARSNIPFEYADKKGKAEFIELLNSDLIQGKILINKELTPLIDEAMTLVWVTEGDKIKIPRKEHPSLPNHRLDALLYNWRMSYHYHSQSAEKKIVKYSKEYYAEQANNIWEKERERLEKLENLNGEAWGDDGSGWGNEY